MAAMQAGGFGDLLSALRQIDFKSLPLNEASEEIFDFENVRNRKLGNRSLNTGSRSH